MLFILDCDIQTNWIYGWDSPSCRSCQSSCKSFSCGKPVVCYDLSIVCHPYICDLVGKNQSHVTIFSYVVKHTSFYSKS